MGVGVAILYQSGAFSLGISVRRQLTRNRTGDY